MFDEEDNILNGDLFEEPDGFRPPPPESHFAKYERKIDGANPKEIELKLVGKSPLWGHMLWNAGIYTANYLDSHKDLIEGKNVLELGAAASLPSLICALNNANEVYSTDYPDPDLMSHITYNFEKLCEKTKISPYKVKGYIWGNDVYESLELKDPNYKFDLIILSDLIFNHTEHHKLLNACQQSINKNGGKCLVVFSPHRAHLLHADLEFFETAKQYGFKSEQIDMQNWSPMFEEDDETKEIRSRVYSYFLIPE
ncbi:unnamed protein product [Candida verbasci]|uniref:Protein N-terminal and lysine N-methyltransferase EFM7 n=1 Tax=Candida verbasci TaxID=1227364 RepID=A0A9W4TSR1_9ASCO|nr:unnamed protein product [Candida verbasci]